MPQTPYSERLQFRHWQESDLELALKLWGDPEVMKYLDVRGGLSREQVAEKLKRENRCLQEHGIQYWPMFEISTGDFVGCCGLKPWVHSPRVGPEFGFHLVQDKWGKGYATEAGRSVIQFARNILNSPNILAGHHPENRASRKILEALGFAFLEYVFFKPTGLQHLSYELKFQNLKS